MNAQKLHRQRKYIKTKQTNICGQCRQRDYHRILKRLQYIYEKIRNV